ncbi:hypothetical protein DUNSADRAFT_3419 [Dunaliella salina]|uniref:Encoded protein n=1 Tax=Dunaliella salina TaxID=3046 RepID=A0ABQ7GU16_DUNSA|nr:hypothetical protein DUNSADRAFT_3419 [Dunaliella salina]|eukprot:KAF5838110.1 hypothetical protein DUNSADRAFT_3419 [Dunaliella salina]
MHPVLLLLLLLLPYMSCPKLGDTHKCNLIQNHVPQELWRAQKSFADSLTMVDHPLHCRPMALIAADGDNSVSSSQSRARTSWMEEKERKKRWIADNTCHKGDTLTIWHVDPAPVTPASRPPSPERTKQRRAHGQGLASLPIALNQVLRVRGLRDVKFQPIYSADGRRKQPDPQATVDLGIEDWHDPTEEVACQVCRKAAGTSPFTVPTGQGGVRLVCVLNYNRLGFIAEVILLCISFEKVDTLCFLCLWSRWLWSRWLEYCQRACEYGQPGNKQAP